MKREDPATITDEERQRAKQLCYALIYGMGANGLASQNGITASEAQGVIDDFMRAFPGVSKFIRETIESAHETGQVSTIGGRIRLLSSLKSADTAETPREETAGHCPPPCQPTNVLRPTKSTNKCAVAKVGFCFLVVYPS